MDIRKGERTWMEAQDVTRSASMEGRGRVFMYTKAPGGGIRM